MTERRFYVRHASPTSPTGVACAIFHTYDGEEFHPMGAKVLFKIEIPPRFWGVPLTDMIAFFERGEKPRRRVPMVAGFTFDMTTV